MRLHHVCNSHGASTARFRHEYCKAIPIRLVGTVLLCVIGAFLFSGCKGTNEQTALNNTAVDNVAPKTDFEYVDTNGGIEITYYSGYGDEAVAIPDHIDGSAVVAIGEGAFQGNSMITKITVPASVRHIGAYAFSECYSLVNVTISDGVKTIGEYAFAYCDSLERVTIPASIESIGDYAFAECKLLRDVSIPSTVINIGNDIFSHGPLARSVGYSIQELQSDRNRRPSIYVLRDDRFYTLEDAELFFGAYSYFEYYDRAFYNESNRAEKLVLSSNDQLVTFSAIDTCILSPIVNMQYCVPAQFGLQTMTDPPQLRLDYVYLRIPDFVSTDIISRPQFEFLDNGPSAASNCLMWHGEYNNNAIIVGKKGEQHVLARYVDTTYEEYFLSCDAALLYFGARVECPVERTTNGYFIIHTEGLTPGDYAVYDGSMKFLIQVVS